MINFSIKQSMNSYQGRISYLDVQRRTDFGSGLAMI